MKNTLLTILAIFTLAVSTNKAQEAIWNNKENSTPEINPDNSVTFRLFAPNAKEVKLSGPWMPSVGWTPGTVNMIKDEKGFWTYKSPALNSDLYYYSFYVDGMKCADPKNMYQYKDGDNISNMFIIGGGNGDFYKVNQVPHGSVTRRWYDSPGNGMSRRISIYTPAGYETSVEKYPVLYLLHGMGGDEEAWISLGNAIQILDNLIAQGKAKPMIVVMPNGNVSQEAALGQSSIGLMQPGPRFPHTMDGKMEETFTEIVHFMDANYRTIPKKSSRAIAGLSMGGFHSLHISRYYPNTFDYIGLFSPAIMPDPRMDSKVYANFDGSLKQQLENGYKLYWIGIGNTDFLYKGVKDYRSKLDSIKMPYIYRETDGGHTWSNWRAYLSEFVPLIFK